MTHKTLSMAIACLTLFLLGGVATASPNDWIVEVVRTDERADWSSSLALDAAGQPHMVYFGTVSHKLKHVYWNGADWVNQVIGSASDPPHLSMALDANGWPRVSYYDFSDMSLKYVHFDGTAWITEVVDTGEDVGLAPSMALDAGGRPHITYSDWSNERLKYAYFDGEAWQVEAVDGIGLGGVSSLAMDPVGQPHVSYYDANTRSLKYARLDGTEWVIEVVDSDIWPGYMSHSLVLDAEGRPHMSYQDSSDGALKYAYFDGTAWRIRVIDGGERGHFYYNSSLVLDTEGQPHVSYHDDDNSVIKYATFDGTTWTIETVAHVDRPAAIVPSLTLDADGQPQIGYYEWGERVLKYAHGFSGPAMPQGTESLTAHVFADYLCDGLFQEGLDVPIEDISVTVRFPNGASRSLKSTPFGMVSLAGFSASDGLTISAGLPTEHKGYMLSSCPNSLTSVDLGPDDFHFGTSHIQFGVTMTGEVASQ